MPADPEDNQVDMKRNDRQSQNREIRQKRREFERQIDELKQKYHEQIYADAHFNESARARRPFRYYHRHIHYSRPIAMALMLAFWIGILLFGGFPLWFRLFIGAIAVLSTISAIMEIFFLVRMDRRILRPIDTLETAVREVAKGNLDVEVKGPFHPETAALIGTFNAMVRALRESETLKKSYEDNRKELIANISHDLKTPITSILGYIDAINDIGTREPEKIEKYLSIIKSNTSYLNKLIDDLFLFSRMDISRLDLSPERVNVEYFLRDLMEEFYLDFGERNILFDYRADFPERKNREPFMATLDPKLFCRIVRNLFDNARKYGPEDSLHLEVTAGITPANETESEESSFFVTIADNGPGLSADAMTHLFERFFRADPERTKSVSSTGLGLAIARELTELQGGKISAANRAEGGLLFTIEMPLERTEG
jgi:signal transduction histidine kinase